MKRDSTNDCAPYCDGCKYAITPSFELKRVCCNEVTDINRGMPDGNIGYYAITARAICRGIRTKTICPFYSKKWNYSE